MNLPLQICRLDELPEPALRFLFQLILQLSACIRRNRPCNPSQSTAASHGRFPRTGARVQRCRVRPRGLAGP